MLDLIFAPVRWFFSFIFGWIMTLVVIIAILLATAGFYVPWIAQKYVAYSSGFEMSFGETHMNLLLGEVDLTDIVLQNPSNYPQRDCLKLNEFAVHLQPITSMGGTLTFDHIIIDLDHLVWIKNAQGETNFIELGNDFSSSKSSSKSSKSSSVNQSSPMAFHIKKLVISVREVTVIDLSGSNPTSKVYAVNYKREFMDVKSVSQIVMPLTADFAKYGLGLIMQTLVGEILSPAQLLNSPISQTVQQTLKSGFQTGSQAAADAAQGTGEAISSLFKSF
jgi:hypothetical protein